jgi:hypothetical protein
MSADSGSGLAVDIVIDNYNYAAFLGAAIESALAQTHERVEVIVVDDGSTDGSRELLATYEGRVEVVLKENGGQASAFNAGIECSRGDVVVFLDADDLLHPETAARAATAFAADRALVKLQCRMDTIDASGRSTGAIKPPPHLPLPNGDVRRAELAFPFDLTWLAMSANAFRAEALRRILPIPEQSYRICADWYLVHLTALLGPVASLEQVGASYRVHGANNYEQQAPRLDLDHVRQTIGLTEATVRALERLADEEHLAPAPGALALGPGPSPDLAQARPGAPPGRRRQPGRDRSPGRHRRPSPLRRGRRQEARLPRLVRGHGNGATARRPPARGALPLRRATGAFQPPARPPAAPANRG